MFQEMFGVKGRKQDYGWYNGCRCQNEAVKDQGRGFQPCEHCDNLPNRGKF